MVSILHNHCFIHFFFLVKNTLYRFYYNLETGPARRVDLGLELSRVEEKIEERKTRWPRWPGKTRSKTRLQPVDFCFFYWNDVVLILKKIDPDDPVIQALNRAGSKNYRLYNMFRQPINKFIQIKWLLDLYIYIYIKSIIFYIFLKEQSQSFFFNKRKKANF